MPKSRVKRKKFSGVQTIVASKTVMRKDFKGELRPVENPDAGKIKKIIHRPQ
jgi:hypothetical protein